MIWSITKRQIVYKLRKMRRCITREEKKAMNHGSSRYVDWVRRNHGIEENEFVSSLFNEEFGPLSGIFSKLRPVYFKNFHSDLKQCIEGCVSDDLIKKENNQGRIFLRDTEKAKEALSVAYFPKKLYAPLMDLIRKI